MCKFLSPLDALPGVTRIAAVLAITLLYLTGCSGSSGPELGQVTGIITLDGQPIQNGVIQFLPDNSRGTSGPVASALVDSSGRYTLTSPGSRTGAVPGHHLVTLVCEELPVREVSEGVFENVKQDCRIPQRYASEATSGLTAEVKAGENTIDFELKSQEQSSAR